MLVKGATGSIPGTDTGSGAGRGVGATAATTGATVGNAVGTAVGVGSGDWHAISTRTANDNATNTVRRTAPYQTRSTEFPNDLDTDPHINEAGIDQYDRCPPIHRCKQARDPSARVSHIR